MTLDEAIEHAKQVAETCDNSECAADHIQLVEWLRQARGAGKAARWYTRKIHELKVENAELREEIEAAKHDLQVFSMCSVQLDAENAKLKAYVEQIESQNAKLQASNEVIAEDHAALCEQNAKLRKLVAHLMYVKPRDITGITYNGKCLSFDDLLAEVGMRWEDA